MNKYHRLRDTRPQGGIRMSVSIAAASAAEADAIFEERWAARNAGLGTPAAPPPAPLPAIITNASLREQFMSPGALEIKRRTPTFR